MKQELQHSRQVKGPCGTAMTEDLSNNQAEGATSPDEQVSSL